MTTITAPWRHRPFPPLVQRSSRGWLSGPWLPVYISESSQEGLAEAGDEYQQEGLKREKMFAKFQQYRTFISSPCIRELNFKAQGAFCVPAIKATIHGEILLSHTSTWELCLYSPSMWQIDRANPDISPKVVLEVHFMHFQLLAAHMPQEAHFEYFSTNGCTYNQKERHEAFFVHF